MPLDAKTRLGPYSITGCVGSGGMGDVYRAWDSRLERYVAIKLLNEELLRQGHAVLATREPNVKHVEKLKKAQSEARDAKRGVWDEKEPLPEAPEKFVAKKKDRKEEKKDLEEQLALTQWEKGCVIGNRKTKKFHVPGGKYYESSKVSKNAIFFKNASDAKKAGYTQSTQ